MSKKIIFTKEQEQEIIDLWLNTDISCRDIAKKFEVSITPIRRIFKNNNIELNNKKQFVRTHVVDDSYFHIIDTEEKAYWLGFIAADGYVSENRVGIGLSIIDIKHLEKFKKTINSDTDIRIIKKEDNGVIRQYCDIRFTSKIMVQDLKKYTIVDNKTFVLDLNILLKYIPEELYSHFMRGYFDGDGTISQNKKTLQPIFSIVLTGKNVNIIKNILKSNNKPIKEIRRTDSWYIQIQSKEEFKRIYHYLYENSTIYLIRKKDKFKYIINNM